MKRDLCQNYCFGQFLVQVFVLGFGSVFGFWFGFGLDIAFGLVFLLVLHGILVALSLFSGIWGCIFCMLGVHRLVHNHA